MTKIERKNKFIFINSVLFTISNWIIKIDANIPPIKMEAALRQWEIIPDALDSISMYDLEAQVRPNETVYFGNYIRPPKNAAFLLYNILWDTSKQEHYTFMLLGLDEPNRAKPTKREYIYMLYTNVHCYAVIGGEEIVEYRKPRVSKKSGIHRYLFIVYRQPDSNLTVSMSRVPKSSMQNRANFNNRKFAKDHNLGQPYALNFFVWRYDGPPQETNATTEPSTKSS